MEARLIALDERLDALEDRIIQLESGSLDSESNDVKCATGVSKDPNKIALRIERAKKQIQDSQTAIILAQTNIESLPSPPRPSLEDKLKILDDQWKLLTQIEVNYQKIIRCAKKNPELAVDTISIQKSIVECQNQKKQVELDKQRILDIMQRNANAYHNRAKTAPVNVKK